ncbi:hypothetical protein [Spirosoma radiotolerans]|uniref:Uncharacterized protein n=1 Tax=Spirosoma radiotolerans TaxID=1379870 RepID=A0A0E3V6R4_9BACT|nr:hypothetical protein [Spirosoma radiotolerans]AKD55247.1 hypothetical protein SD10_10345 [Spirosoma radiotolerans]
MSVKNFYQTVYQTDTIFRVDGESWALPTEATMVESPAIDSALVIDHTPDLLSELDELLVSASVVPADAVEIVIDTPPIVAVLPTLEPAPAKAPPEPLPQPAPRPTTPSILPPIQKQPRMPQLNHKVLLLADEELDPSNLLFLEKILKAVNLNVDGVDLLNLHGVQGMDFAELLRGKYINHFITFGVPFERINLDIMMDRYSPVRFEGITFLMADSLPTIEADQNLKKRLWSALQRVFRL